MKYKIGDLVAFKEYCYHSVLKFKIGLIVAIDETPGVFFNTKVLVEEKIYDVLEEEFDIILPIEAC